MKKTLLTLLGSAVLCAGMTLSGCSSKEPPTKPQPKFDSNAPIFETKASEEYRDVSIVGKSYYPGFKINQTVKISYGKAFTEQHHEHEIPIQISQPEKYFLFVEIDGKTYEKQVNESLFRDAPNKGIIRARYVERVRTEYKAGAEREEVRRDLEGIEILSLEVKKRDI